MKKIYLIKKNINIFFIFFLLIILLITDLIFTKYDFTHTFLIKPNQSLNKITNNLYKERIIENEFFFKFFVVLSMSQKKLKAGEYKFYNNNILQIIKKIRIGDVHQRKITIPEGLTTKQIIKVIKQSDGIIIDNEANFRIKEGMLFPSTYFYVYGTNFNIIINNMKKRMELTLLDAWKNRDKDLDLKNYKDVLILASIVEKETSLNYEKSNVAQVFLNRLRLNMKLQSDPTVIYGIKKELNNDIKELKKRDLDFKSEFNTYMIHGLPKEPICNPGKESITAAAKPSKGDLLYFVANGKGGHNFSTNYKDHLENIKILKKYNEENKN